MNASTSLFKKKKKIRSVIVSKKKKLDQFLLSKKKMFFLGQKIQICFFNEKI